MKTNRNVPTHKSWITYVVFFACIASAKSVFSATTQSINPIPNFRTVTATIFRGGRPERKGLEFLKTKGVKTIINLENIDDVVAEEKNDAGDLGLRYESFPMSPYSTPNDHVVDQVQALLADSSVQPLFIHCHHGEDRTGVLVGLFRVFNQTWDARKAYDEMIDLGFHKFLFKLDDYFEEKTGLDNDSAANAPWNNEVVENFEEAVN